MSNFPGYVFGLCHKLLWQERVDGAVWLYLFNLVMVATDLCLYYRNHLIDKTSERGCGQNEGGILGM